MVKELWWSDASLQSYCNVNFMKNAYVSTVLELWVAFTLWGRIRSPWFFDHFLPAFNALSDCVSLLLIELPNLNHIALDGLNPLSLRFDGLYFRSYQKLARPTFIVSLQILYSFFQMQKQLSHRGVQQIFRKVFGSRTIVRFFYYENSCYFLAPTWICQPQLLEISRF